jgi:hypothetical protein
MNGEPFVFVFAHVVLVDLCECLVASRSRNTQLDAAAVTMSIQTVSSLRRDSLGVYMPF